jgi:hypothetical protein
MDIEAPDTFEDETGHERLTLTCPTCGHPMYTPFQPDTSAMLDWLVTIEEAVKQLKGAVEAKL